MPHRRFILRTEFDHRISVVANFGGNEFAFLGDVIPARSVLVLWKSGKKEIYSP